MMSKDARFLGRMLVFVGIIFSIFSFFPSQTFADGLFTSKVDYATGSGPRSVITGLFNADAYPDLAVVNQNSNTISIFLGNGDGTFQTKVDYVTGSYPQSVTTGLFNADAYLDLVVANGSSSTVSIFLGNGNGTFQTKVDYGTGTGPYFVTTGLFNSDAYLDLAVVNYSNSTVSILLGNGNGTFQTKVDYGTGTGPYFVTTGLFNADAYLDLAVANYNSATVSIFLGNGNGTFQTKVDYVTGTNPYFVTTGLFNADEYLDLAVLNYNSSTVSILLGNGDGTFQTKVDYATGANPYSITAGLFNGDAYLDLVVVNQNSNTISIFLGNGNGTFQTKVDYVTGTNPRSVTTGLFNSDEYLDLAVANWSSNTVSILLNAQGITAPSEVTNLIATTVSDTQINLSWTAPVDNGGSPITGYKIERESPIGGGWTTIISDTGNNGTAYGNSSLSYATTYNYRVSATNGVQTSPASNTSSATTLAQVTPPSPFTSKVDYSTGTGPNSVITGLFNNDAYPDLAVTNQSSNTVSILLGNGNGTFQTKVDYVTGSNPLSITTGLFNADAYLDLAVVNWSSNKVSIFLGNGNGTFQTKVDYATGASPYSITTGLFNADAYLDLAVVNSNSNTVSIFLGNGDGTFQTKVDYATGSAPRFVTTGLFNSDAYPDLAVVNSNSNTVSIFLGNGDGTFQTKVDYTTGSNPQYVTTGLFNSDAYLDLAVANYNSATVSIFLGNGDGTFQTKVDYATGSGPNSVTTGLFNSDAYLDLAVVNGNNNKVSIFLGNGNGTFQTKVDYATGSAPRSVTTGLFNGDAYTDLALVNANSNTVSLFLNAQGFTSPSEVTNLIATAVSDTQINLSWTAPVNNGGSPISGYKIERESPVGGGWTTIISDTGNNGTVYSSILLSPSTTYNYRVSATNGAYTSIPSNTASAITQIHVTPPTLFVSKVDYGTGSYPQYVTNGLFNSDTYPDLVVANFSSNTISIFLGVGDGTFGTKVDYTTGSGPYSVINGLFNNDAYPDLAVTNQSSNTVSILLGNGNGTFQTKVDYTTGANPRSVTTRLFNSDAYLDLAVVNQNSNTISIFLGNGNGTFQTKVDYVTGSYPYSITTGLFNNDAYLDLAVVNNGNSTVSIFFGVGDGTFGTKVDYTTGSNPQYVTTGLFNSDAYLDLTVANYNSATVSIFLGNGDGTFQTKVDYGTRSYPGFVTTGLFNSDEYLDLAVANGSSSTVSILLGNGNGTFQTKVDYTTGSNPSSITTGLFNGDAYTDLAIANNGSATVSILIHIYTPTITTSSATSVTLTTATLNGNITSTGGENPTVRGFNYGLTTSYGTDITLNGSFSTGTYTSNITSLSCGTTYHYRAYATNSAGTGYGDDAEFTTGTCPTISAVITDPASSITTTTATLNGNITSTGGENPTVRGFNYGLTTSYGTDITLNGSFSTGAFTSNLTNLTCATTYHYRAYATNQAGTGYGSDTTFTTAECSVSPTITTTIPNDKTSITVSWTGNTSNYYVENITNNVNSNWITNSSYQFVDLICDTDYSFRTKGKGDDNIETDWSEIVTTSIPCVAVIEWSPTGSGTITTQEDFESGDLDSTINPTTTPGDLLFNEIPSVIHFITKWGNEVSNTTHQASITKDISLPSPWNWEEKTLLPAPVMAAGNGVIDGKIYIAGGTDSNGDPFDSLFIYDPTENTWDDTKASLPYPTTSAVAGVINGKLYVAGGKNLDWNGIATMEIYDPANDTWDTTKASMSVGRVGAAGDVYNGKLYVVGGAPINYGSYYISGEAYDPQSDTWTPIAGAPKGIKFTGSTAKFINGILYVAGGQNYDPFSNRIIAYDPATNTWNTSLAPMPATRAGGSSVVIDGKFYYIGGTNEVEWNSKADIFVYDPSTDTWTTYAGSLPQDIHRSSSQMVGDDLYVIGGRDYDWNAIDTNYKINKANIGIQADLPKKITKLTWDASVNEGESVEMFYSIDDGTTYTSLGITPGAFDLPTETKNRITYKVVYSNNNTGTSVNIPLNSLSLTYTYDSSESEYQDPLNTWARNNISPVSGAVPLSSQRGLTTDSNGNIYVADPYNNLVQKFDPSGNFIAKFGGYGSDFGTSFMPFDIAIDSNDNVYSLEGDDKQTVFKSDSDGNLISNFGFYGYGDNEGKEGTFNSPYGIDIDSGNNIYITDSGNNRIQKFNSDGEFISTFGWGVADGTDEFQVCTSNCQIGISGNGDGEFSNPTGIAVDSLGNIYVVNQSNNRIQKFTSEGVYVTQWGTNGSGNGEFNGPYSIATDSTNNVYVADTYNNRIQKFNSDGEFISTFGWGVADGTDEFQVCISNCQIGINGNSDGELSSPMGIAIDSSDNIYVADTGNNRIQKFYQNTGISYESSGTYISPVITTGKHIDWSTIDSDSTLPDGTSIVFMTRSGPGAIPNDTWSSWEAANGDILSPNNKHIQIKATLSTTDTTLTPVLHSITLNYTVLPDPEYTLTYTAGSNGTISGTTPQTVVENLNGTAVTAIPNSGYHFVNWSDNNTSNPRTDLNIQNDLSVTANFSISDYALTYTDGSNGTIEGNTSQVITYGSNGTAVTAVPNSGYHFVNWSDNNTSNPRTDLNIQGNISVTANFVINANPVSHSSSGSSIKITPQTFTPILSQTPQIIPNINSIPTITLPSLSITKTLKLKSAGEDVKLLQTHLNTLGYNTGTPDGSFGPKTLEAIKKFQQDNNLVPDGIVGPNTLDILNKTPITTSPNVNVALLQTSTVLRVNNSKFNNTNEVIKLQEFLINKGYLSGSADGLFGKQTLEAVILFQKANGLTPDGVVGPKTRGVMK